MVNYESGLLQYVKWQVSDPNTRVIRLPVEYVIGDFQGDNGQTRCIFVLFTSFCTYTEFKERSTLKLQIHVVKKAPTRN